MKQLLVLRHAKSDWGAGSTSDHDRPLNPRGEGAAAHVGEMLARTDQLPDRVITSTARRAADTVARAAKAGSWPCPVQSDSNLYEATVTDVLEVVAGCPADVERLLIAGHEPTSSGLVGYLIGASVRFPTAALATIDLPIEEWQELAPDAVSAGIGQLRSLVIPRLIGPMLNSSR